MKSPSVVAISCVAWLPLALAGCDQIGIGSGTVDRAASASPTDQAGRLIGVWIAYRRRGTGGRRDWPANAPRLSPRTPSSSNFNPAAGLPSIAAVSPLNNALR